MDPHPPDPRSLLNQRARQFDDQHARRLRALAYRMLGSRADAEDIVQEAWLRWAEVDEAEVRHAQAYLTRLVTHLCLDRLGSAAARREHYVGVWLPEPLLDADERYGLGPGPEQQAEFAQDVSVAFLLALERLSPLERAAFLLKDVFDVDYDEIAGQLGRSPTACRQLVSRARRSLRDGHVRQVVSDEQRQRLAQAFVAAVRNQDVGGLARLLSDDALMLADGGGKVSALPRPLRGGERVAKVFLAFCRLPEARDWLLRPAAINGLPGLVVLSQRNGLRVVQTITLAPAADGSGRIAALYVQRNPDKLSGAQSCVTDAPAISSCQ